MSREADKMMEQTLQRCAPAVAVLRDLEAVNVETTTWKGDYGAVHVTRWVVSHRAQPTRFLNVVLYATPDWWDLFIPISASRKVDDVFQALRTWVTS